MTLYWVAIGAALVLSTVLDHVKRVRMRRKYERALERESRMRIVAEAAFETLAEAWGEQFAMNRYRVSEMQRALRKLHRDGGPPN